MNWFARKISRDQDIKQMREQENLGELCRTTLAK